MSRPLPDLATFGELQRRPQQKRLPKPHLYWGGDEWQCSLPGGILGFGPTPFAAYADWVARWSFMQLRP